jgi:hypothetical protein
MKRMFDKNVAIPKDILVISESVYPKEATGDTPKSAFTEKVIPNANKNKPII